MSKIALWLAHLRHWQAFLVVCVPYMASPLFLLPSMEDMPNTPEALEAVFTRMMLIMIPIAAILFAWIWTIGYISNRSTEPVDRRPERPLNLSVAYAFVYLLLGRFIFPSPARIDDPLVPIGIFVPLHILAVGCTMYAMAASAMRLKTFELGTKVGLGEALGTFFLIWFFPVGIWFVQPQLNRAARAIADES